MNNLLAKHPNMKEIITSCPQLNVYKILSEDGEVVEYWEKDKKGHWNDVTEREKLKEQIAKEQEELERLRKREARAKEKKDEQATIEGAD